MADEPALRCGLTWQCFAFGVRSYNHENIGTSISNGVWATQAHNEKKLADAFDSGEEARRALERPASLCHALTTCFSRVFRWC
jgi:hypothetical protein